MTTPLSRRALLGRAVAASGVAAAAATLAGSPAHAGSPAVAGVGAGPARRSSRPRRAADPATRVLVVIEMPGGNDGMSTVVPFGHPGYYDLRSSTAIPAADVLRIDEQVGLHPNLKRISGLRPAVIQGVGSSKPDGSHFEMMRRWWAGDPLSADLYDTGWIGRVADAIGDPASAAVAVSIGSGAHPILRSKKAATLALPSAEAAKAVADPKADDAGLRAFQRGLKTLTTGTRQGPLEQVRSSMAAAVHFAETLHSLGDRSTAYPDGELGAALGFTRQLIGLDAGVRLVHVPMSGDFDTHENHSGRHPALMAALDAAVGAFADDLDANGLAERVLIMTTSEFGRTAAENGSGGLDHGTASAHLLVGPVIAGLHGQHPSLTERDANNDLVATMNLDQYLGSVVEAWLGMPASEVFASRPAAIGGLVQP